MPVKAVSALFLLFLVLGFPLSPESDIALAQDSPETLTRRKKIEEEEEKRGNIYNLLFGSAPSMPTERGLLILNAFHDLNQNLVRDPGENFLRNEIVCVVDGVLYRVPAFIPALKLYQNYLVRCASSEERERFRPIQEEEEVFVERRGQVFEIGIPCEPVNKERTPFVLSPESSATPADP